MDVVEHSVTIGDGFSFTAEQPVVWRNKTAREVQRAKYPDHYFSARAAPPKSTRADVDYPRSFSCAPYPAEKPRVMKEGECYATLTEIDR